jgi:hypothetical protein
MSERSSKPRLKPTSERDADARRFSQIRKIPQLVD